MKAYLVCTASIFGLLGGMHGVRLFVEGGHTLADDPAFFLGNAALCLVGGALAGWALTLLRAQRRGHR